MERTKVEYGNERLGMKTFAHERYIAQLIEKHLTFLYNRGFKIVAGNVDRKHFGAWVVELRSEEGGIRIIQDRGEISIAAAPQKASRNLMDMKDYFGIGLLRDYIEGTNHFVLPHNKSRDLEDNLETESQILKKYIDRIFTILNDENYSKVREELFALHQKQIKSIFPGANFTEQGV